MRRRRFSRYPRHFYRQVEVTNRPSIWPRLGGLLLLGLFGAVVWWVGFSPSWRITDVRVEGVDDATGMALATSFNLVGQNIFRLDLSTVESQLTSQPTVDSYQIVRQLPHRLIISLKERQPVLVWQTAGHGWLVDATGRAYRELTGDRPAVPLVVDTANIAVKQNDVIVPLSFTRALGLFEDKLPKLYNQPVREYDLGETLYDVDAVMSDGRVIKFNILSDVATQLTDLGRLATQRPDLFGRSSIDLRVDRWAYVK